MYDDLGQYGGEAGAYTRPIAKHFSVNLRGLLRPDVEIFPRAVIACATKQTGEEMHEMLFVESKTLRQSVDGAARMALLERLQEKGLTPLIRSTRVSCYEQALLGPDRADEMERAVAAWTESEDARTYIRGDVFCFEDFVLFLIFGEADEEADGVRAGIVYGAETLEPTKKLDAFCHNVLDALEATDATSRGTE